MASAVDSRLAYARLSAVATASRLPTANRGSNNSYTTSWDTTSRNITGEPLLINESPHHKNVFSWANIMLPLVIFGHEGAQWYGRNIMFVRV